MAKMEALSREDYPRFVNGTVRQTERRDAAYRAAREEIEALGPGETIQYHEGNLAADVATDHEIAGRAAAFLDAATERGEGAVAQRRIRFEWYQYMFHRSGA
jgi:hypothetical protein